MVFWRSFLHRNLIHFAKIISPAKISIFPHTTKFIPFPPLMQTFHGIFPILVEFSS